MADHDRRKRRRLAKSCEQCRQRKVRCDRKAPCGPCTRARGSLSCSYRNSNIAATASLSAGDALPSVSYPDRLHHKGPGNHPTPASYDETELESVRESTQGPESPAQVASLIGSLQHRLQRVEELVSRRGHNPASGQDASLDQALRELSTRVQGIEERLSGGISFEKNAAFESGLCVDAPHPRLHASTSKMKLLGPSHYANTAEKVILSLNASISQD